MLYRVLRNLRKETKHLLKNIEDKNDGILMEVKDIKERWKEHLWRDKTRIITQRKETGKRKNTSMRKTAGIDDIN